MIGAELTTGQIYYRENREKVIAAVQDYWKRHPEKRKEYHKRSNVRTNPIHNPKTNAKKLLDLKIYASLEYEYNIQKYSPENILFNDNFKAMINDSRVIREFSV